MKPRYPYQNPRATFLGQYGEFDIWLSDPEDVGGESITPDGTQTIHLIYDENCRPTVLTMGHFKEGAFGHSVWRESMKLALAYLEPDPSVSPNSRLPV